MNAPVRTTHSAYVSASELYTLLASGYQPISVVVGVAALSMGTRGFARGIRSIFTKGEMTAVSETAQNARVTAIARAQSDAQKLGADLMIIHHVEVRDLAEVVEVTCYGSALKKVGEFKPMQIAAATN